MAFIEEISSSSWLAGFKSPAKPKMFSVSKIMADVKSYIETKFRGVYIVGEISLFKSWFSGHWYFDLKDA